jgi:hypothetical protein
VAKKRAKKTNISKEHKRAFNALGSGEYGNFALFSCFVNGEPSAAIVAIEKQGGERKITPLFVALTPGDETEGSRWTRTGVIVRRRK